MITICRKEARITYIPRMSADTNSITTYNASNPFHNFKNISNSK